MKTAYFKTLITTLTLLVIMHQLSFGQDKPDATIRKLEQLEAVSIQKGDTTTLLKLWGKNFVCNNPYGFIVTPPQVIRLIREGQIDYFSYERDVERITFIQNLAIVMGKEVVVPRNKTPNAGKTITMRYTHVWIKNDGLWRLMARQVSNF
jgi:hypothetical protein